MRPPSKPEINRDNPNQYFIFFNIDVPAPLWHKYPRKRIRMKIYDDINRFKGQEREDYAEHRRQVWEYKLRVLNHNPFEEQLNELNNVAEIKDQLTTNIQVEENLMREQSRLQVPIRRVFDLFIDSRKERTDNTNSHSTYKGTIKWLTEYFETLGLMDKPGNKITRAHIAEALNTKKKAKSWSPTTYNKELDFAMTVFNWMAREEYIDKNPALGKIEKMPTKKKMHKWYNRDEAKAVKKALLNRNELRLYRAMAFTYFLLIRSQQELLKLKFQDIDRTLKRVHFRDDLSKNNSEQFRDYPPAFDKILNDMKFDSYPKDWYVFGKNGKPSAAKSGKNYLADLWRPIRDELKLTEYHTIYSWKHTRIIHEMMKGTDGYEITYMARHNDYKTTDDYKRDYDFTLTNVYKSEDLTF